MRAGALVAAALALASASDVVPRCGTHHRPEPMHSTAGGECGGPANCPDGTSCYRMDVPKGTGALVCTKPCTADAECATLAAAMTCSGTGSIDNQPPGAHPKVCAKQSFH